MAQRDDTSQSMSGAMPPSSSMTNTGDGQNSDIDSVKAEANRQFDRIRERARTDVDSARMRAEGFANEQKDYAASQLAGVATAVRKVADELSGDQAAVSRYAVDIADGLEHLSDQARSSSVGDMVKAAESFGRRQPAAFLGAAVLLGFAASRFIGASSHRSSEDRSAFNGDRYASRSSGSAANGTQSTQNRYGETLHG